MLKQALFDPMIHSLWFKPGLPGLWFPLQKKLFVALACLPSNNQKELCALLQSLSLSILSFLSQKSNNNGCFDALM